MKHLRKELIGALVLIGWLGAGALFAQEESTGGGESAYYVDAVSEVQGYYIKVRTYTWNITDYLYSEIEGKFDKKAEGTGWNSTKNPKRVGVEVFRENGGLASPLKLEFTGEEVASVVKNKKGSTRNIGKTNLKIELSYTKKKRGVIGGGTGVQIEYPVVLIKLVGEGDNKFVPPVEDEGREQGEPQQEEGKAIEYYLKASSELVGYTLRVGQGRKVVEGRVGKVGNSSELSKTGQDDDAVVFVTKERELEALGYDTFSKNDIKEILKGGTVQPKTLDIGDMELLVELTKETTSSGGIFGYFADEYPVAAFTLKYANETDTKPGPTPGGGEEMGEGQTDGDVEVYVNTNPKVKGTGHRVDLEVVGGVASVGAGTRVFGRDVYVLAGVVKGDSTLPIKVRVYFGRKDLKTVAELYPVSGGDIAIGKGVYNGVPFSILVRKEKKIIQDKEVILIWAEEVRIRQEGQGF